MQTFLPVRSFYASAAHLDYRRLGKQRVEAWQILNALLSTDETKRGWRNHPATLMWRNHERYLCLYGIAICLEWRRRGYRDSMLDRFNALLPTLSGNPPSWLGRKAFHDSHKSNLIRKDPAFYQPKWPRCPPDLPYVWPSTTPG